MLEKQSKDIVKKYTKTALLRSKKYIKYKDLLKILLEDDEHYTIENVEKILNNYLKRRVK